MERSERELLESVDAKLNVVIHAFGLNNSTPNPSKKETLKNQFKKVGLKKVLKCKKVS